MPKKTLNSIHVITCSLILAPQPFRDRDRVNDDLISRSDGTPPASRCMCIPEDTDEYGLV